MNMGLDARHTLPAISVPTLVVHRLEDADYLPAEGRYLASHIAGAELVELPGRDHGWWVRSGEIADEIERFLTDLWNRGEWNLVETDRILAQHHAIVRRQLVRYSGREIDTAGDGFFASFDGPARAIRCACAIRDGVRELGLDVRAGLHTGECEVVDGKVAGIAVHIGARVAGHASPGEVLVSNTVRDLVAGSGIQFDEHGAAELKGIPGQWGLFSVTAV